METLEERVAIYHVMPLCKKCDSEVSRIQKASERAGITLIAELKRDVRKRLIAERR